MRDPSGDHCLGGTNPPPISTPPSGQDNGKTPGMNRKIYGISKKIFGICMQIYGMCPTAVVCPMGCLTHHRPQGIQGLLADFIWEAIRAPKRDDVI